MATQQLTDVEKKILRDQEILSKLRIAVAVRGPESEDAEYRTAEFTSDDEERKYLEKKHSDELKFHVRRRKRLAKKEERRHGGPIVLWTLKEAQKGKGYMAKKAEMEQKEEKAKEEKVAAKEKAKEKAEALKTKEKEKKAKEKEKAEAKKGKEKKGKKEKSVRGPRVVDGTITLLEKTNPKREGTRAHKRYELYRKHKSIADYLEAGGKRSSLRYDERHEYIKLSKVVTTEDKK